MSDNFFRISKGLTLTPQSEPSSPQDGDVYLDESTNIIRVRQNSKWVDIGPGGSGGINWVGQGSSDFESGIGNWETFNESPYTDGTGGTVAALSLAQTTTASEVLNGDGSLKISKSASDGSGDGASILTEEIGRGYRGRVHYLRFLWEPGANYTSEDLKIRAFGVDSDAGANSKIIPVIPISGALEDSNGLAALPDYKTEVVLKVLPDENHDKVRASLYLPSDSTTGTAWDNIVDDFKLSPDQVVPGAIIEEWESFTPTGDWTTNTTYTGFRRRVGDTMEIEYKVSLSGAPNSANLIVDMPSGFSVDEAKLTETGTIRPLGYGLANDSGGDEFQLNILYTGAGDSFLVRFLDVEATNGASVRRNVDDTTPITWGSGDYLVFRVQVPIEGWSAGAQRSTTENAFKNAIVTANASSAQSLPNASFEQINIDTAEDGKDPLNILDATNNQVVIPQSDWYLLSGSVGFDSGSSVNRRIARVNVDGSPVLETVSEGVSEGDESVPTGSKIKYLEKDSVVTLVGAQYTGGAINTKTTIRETYLTVASWKDLSAFSVTGEYEREEVEITSDTSTSSADTWTDVAGSSFTVNPGTHLIGYNVLAQVFNNSGSSRTVNGTVALFDSSNNLVRNSLTYVGSNLAAGNSIKFNPTGEAEIKPTSQAEYKLRIRCNDASADGQVTLRADSFDGGFTDPDNVSLVYFERKQ